MTKLQKAPNPSVPAFKAWTEEDKALLQLSQARKEIVRLQQQLADACAEIDRLREYCDTHGMPGLETDEE